MSLPTGVACLPRQIGASVFARDSGTGHLQMEVPAPSRCLYHVQISHGTVESLDTRILVFLRDVCARARRARRAAPLADQSAARARRAIQRSGAAAASGGAQPVRPARMLWPPAALRHH